MNDNDRDSNRQNTDVTRTAPFDEQGSELNADVVSTNDPVITPGAGLASEWRQHPDATMVIKTNRVGEPPAGRPPGVIVVPYEEKTSAEPAGGNDRRAGGGDASPPKREAETSSNETSSQAKSDVSRPSGRESGEGHGSKDRERKQDDHDRETRATPTQPSMTKVLMMSALVALVCGMAGAWGYSYFFGEKSKSGENQQSSSGDKQSSAGGSGQEKSGSSSKSSKGSNGDNSGPTSNATSSTSGASSSEGTDALRKQMQELSQRFDALQRRMDRARDQREHPSEDAHELQAQIEGLTQAITSMSDLPSRVSHLDSRLETLKQQVQFLRERSTALSNDDPKPPVAEDETRKVIPSSGLAPAVHEAPPSVGGSPEAALNQAIELFLRRHYPSAANILAKLRATGSEDARVWYFSAMVQGLTSGDWTSQARQFAEQGARHEREGTPSRAAIDSALSGVSRTQGSDWIKSFREQGARSL